MNEIDIEVKWSYPKAFEKIIETEIAQSGWGIYYISRKFGENETLLYIGITYAQNFKARLDSHSWNWFKNYRGRKLTCSSIVFRLRSKRELVRNFIPIRIINCVSDARKLL